MTGQETRLAVPVTIDPASLERFDPGAPVIELAGETMGTSWRVRLAHGKHASAPTVLRAGIVACLDRLTRSLSHWDPASLLMRYNRARAGTWVQLTPDFAQVVTAGLEIARASEGAFDPAIGRMTDIWSLGPNRHPGPPDAATLAAARQASGWQALAFAAPWLRQPGGLWLDLSGIAKGYAADAVADTLARLGVDHALVEVGGECTGRGLRPDGDPWWVDLEGPPGLPLAPLRIALHQLALATSGAYLGIHTLDPRTGLPCADALQPDMTLTASVLHRQGAHADAWASALLVAGMEKARALATREQLAARLVAASGEEWLSPALTAMLAD